MIKRLRAESKNINTKFLNGTKNNAKLDLSKNETQYTKELVDKLRKILSSVETSKNTLKTSLRLAKVIAEMQEEEIFLINLLLND